MPYLIRRPRLQRTMCLLAGTMALVAAAPAVASACTMSSAPAKQLLAPFGDAANYQLAPAGSFEAGTSGWTLNGSSVQSGQEPYFVSSTTDAHALKVPSSSQPVSPTICVSAATPTFRFFARQVSGGWSELNINVLWTDSAGVSHVTTAGGLSPTTSWGLTQVYDLGAMLPLWQPGSTLPVRIQFVPASGGGTVAIDDILIDPYSR
jgi:hypothetical protein